MTARSGTPERVRPRLVQEYVAGLRFQSELQAWSARGWSDLPRPLPGDAPDHARLCLALLGVRQPRHEAGRARPDSGESANLGWLVSRRETHLVSDVACEKASFTGTTALRQLGPLIRRIVHAGAAAMLHIQEPAHPDSARWVLVAGVESSTHEETPGAILLLDPGRGFP